MKLDDFQGPLKCWHSIMEKDCQWQCLLWGHDKGQGCATLAGIQFISKEALNAYDGPGPGEALQGTDRTAPSAPCPWT